MRVFVKAKPGAKVARVTRVSDADAEGLFAAGGTRGAAKDADVHFVVSVKERATEGRANRAIEEALAEHFNVPPSHVRIVSGHTLREKIVEIRKVI